MSRIMPAMSDARAFTDYTSAGTREARMRDELGAATESQFREYLQGNALRVAASTAKADIVQQVTPGRFYR